MIKNFIKKQLYKITDFLLSNHAWFYNRGKVFKESGKCVSYNVKDYFTYQNITLGNDVSIGSGAVFIASKSQIYIGNKVLFGPRVTIIGGNHTFDRVGVFIYDITDEIKDPEDDADIVIEDDVWIGANVTILKGVTIGRGCVIGAGAVVSRSCAPYSIVAGVPAKIIKRRFTVEEILEHERILYPEPLRYRKEEIMSFCD